MSLSTTSFSFLFKIMVDSLSSVLILALLIHLRFPSYPSFFNMSSGCWIFRAFFLQDAWFGAWHLFRWWNNFFIFYPTIYGSPQLPIFSSQQSFCFYRSFVVISAFFSLHLLCFIESITNCFNLPRFPSFYSLSVKLPLHYVTPNSSCIYLFIFINLG